MLLFFLIMVITTVLPIIEKNTTTRNEDTWNHISIGVNGLLVQPEGSGDDSVVLEPVLFVILLTLFALE